MNIEILSKIYENTYLGNVTNAEIKHYYILNTILNFKLHNN